MPTPGALLGMALGQAGRSPAGRETWMQPCHALQRTLSPARPLRPALPLAHIVCSVLHPPQGAGTLNPLAPTS